MGNALEEKKKAKHAPKFACSSPPRSRNLDLGFMACWAGGLVAHHMGGFKKEKKGGKSLLTPLQRILETTRP